MKTLRLMLKSSMVSPICDSQYSNCRSISSCDGIASYQFKPPVEYHGLSHSVPPWNMLVSDSRFKMIPILPDSPKHLRQKAKEYMLTSFYQEAPIPIALGLNERLSKGCKETSKYIDEEMDAHLDSGVSIVVVHNTDTPKPQKIVACGYSKIWERNEKYVIDQATDVETWHNLAALKASQNKDSTAGILEWRSLQTLHIYNLGQKLLSLSTKRYALYFAMLHIHPSARSCGISSQSILSTMLKEFDIDECLVYAQSNFPGFDKVIYNLFPSPIIVDKVLYKDEKLMIDDKRCFEKIDNLNGLTFFAELFGSQI